ncbi:type II toxin-antitoxin system RelE/ParE family toxin [Cryomorpha ignava]|uniref:Type II toxin-antitoxin system RelE/ParE family toxin n=1 Tax=Cryomorpha ignava TaxID=101383 RepID=A0A7K3WY86_9FLAO|nr:type II toxin-antitoxin system RelE/ParE family toxin [Cryomorpha ignava]NEN25615.1 type II toxin-antitoxin system RelE/ParE family toxin [Cryomorpha ignava]
MRKYKISNDAEADLIRIHQFGIRRFGMAQADEYFSTFLEYFDLIAQRPLSLKSVDFISEGVRCYTCGSDSIYYTFSGDMVEILAIVGKQDLKSIF